MADRDIYAEAGHVSCAEAREIHQRYHNDFCNEGPGPRLSIPVNPRRDDDIRLEAFVKRVERLEADARLLAKLRAHPDFNVLLTDIEENSGWGEVCTLAVQLLRGA